MSAPQITGSQESGPGLVGWLMKDEAVSEQERTQTEVTYDVTYDIALVAEKNITVNAEFKFDAIPEPNLGYDSREDTLSVPDFPTETWRTQNWNIRLPRDPNTDVTWAIVVNPVEPVENDRPFAVVAVTVPAQQSDGGGGGGGGTPTPDFTINVNSTNPSGNAVDVAGDITNNVSSVVTGDGLVELQDAFGNIVDTRRQSGLNFDAGETIPVNFEFTAPEAGDYRACVAVENAKVVGGTTVGGLTSAGTEFHTL